jgi:hypothetical protein
VDAGDVERLHLESPHKRISSQHGRGDGPPGNDADLQVSVNVVEQRFVQRLVQDGFAKDVHEVVARMKSELQD